MLTMEQVVKAYRTDSVETRALDGVSLQVEAGDFLAIMGPSGCGKTTLINLLAGYVRPDIGECLIDGKPITDPGPDRMVVFQETALLPWKTLWENVIYGPMVQGKDLMEIADRAERLINMVGLTGFEDRKSVV